MNRLRITIPEVNAFNVGALIALYERAVGFYASIVNINAYHQPGVEAGKKAATRVLELQKRVRGKLERRAWKNRGGNRRVARGGSRKMSSIFCDIWRRTIRRFRSRAETRLRSQKYSDVGGSRAPSVGTPLALHAELR